MKCPICLKEESPTDEGYCNNHEGDEVYFNSSQFSFIIIINDDDWEFHYHDHELFTIYKNRIPQPLMVPLFKSITPPQFKSFLLRLIKQKAFL